MSDLEDGSFDWEGIDYAAVEAQAKSAPPGPSRQLHKQPTFTQHTLHGKPLAPPPNARAGPSKPPPPARAPPEPRQPETIVSKLWDRSTFQRTGWGGLAEGKGKAKGKAKAKVLDPDDEFYDSYTVEEDIDLSKLYDDPDLNPDKPPPPMKLVHDAQEAKTFLYPLNKPRRDYQYNIVRRALFTNVLCALPTGLGKTFIAAVVMLNFHRWYPKGKILFMAPTRPLVDQQITACHGIVGIPSSHAALITGKEPPPKRALAYQERSLLYGTPQTFVNDLKTGRLDPSQVICVVVDEAHRATGDYAYCGVVRYLMTKNPHFRILALTATPGSKSEAVQNVIDNLHIGHIEIRCEDSLDLRQYVHKKDIQEKITPVEGDLLTIRDGLVELMKPDVKRMCDLGVIYHPDPAQLKPFACQCAQRRLQPNQKWAWAILNRLRIFAQALQYLLEQTITACLDELGKNVSDKGNKKDGELQRLIDQIKKLQGIQGYVIHPKVDLLRSMLIEHFTNDETGDTRVMVFCSYRGVVEELVASLNEQQPLIRATRFVGQSADKKGGKGFTQVEQRKAPVITHFREGVFNTMIATQIGEEGLDIGEVDLIINYDSNKSPIRMLQRIGRTGRARQGKIFVLLTEGHDEQSWQKAQDSYAEVQAAILKGKTLELFSDCERLLPREVQPAPVLKALEVPAFDYDDLVIAGEKGKKAASAAKGTKRKRDFVPDGAEIGFRKASDIVGAGAPKEPTLEERKTAAILDEDELAYLDSHWRRKPPEDSLIAGIRDDAPLGLPLASRIDPSSHHARLRQAVQIASTMSDKAMRADWESKAVFRRQLVHDWPTDRRGTAVERNHLSCRLPPPASPYKSAPPVKAMAKVEIAPIVGKEEDSKPMVNEDGELLFIIKDDAIDSDEDGDLPDPALLFSGGPAGRSAIARSKPQAPSVVPSSLTHTAGSRRSTPLVIEIDSDNEVDPLMLFKDDEGETDTAVGTTPEGDEDDGVATGAASPELGETPREPQLFRASSPELGADNNKKEAPAAEELHELDEDGDAPMREPSPELLFAVHGMTSSDDHFTSPVVSPVPYVPSPPPTRTLKKDSSHDEFDDLDLDDDALAELDAAQPRSIADIDLMPPPPVSAASRRGPREISANLLMTQQRPRSIPRKKSLTAIEASPSFARLQKTASIVIDDSSSPQIVVPGRRANQPRIVQTSEEEDEERPRAPPRRIVGPRLVRKRDEVEEEEEAPRKRKKKRRDGPRGVALHRYDIFDVEAVDDDADGNESSEAEVESENDSDRAFVDQSMAESDDSMAMHAIYRESMMSQAPAMGFGEAAVPAGAYRMRYVGGWNASKAAAADPDDTFERDSFCASDNESLVYATSSQGGDL